MRLILMFDLPSVTSSERRVYAQFRKFLLSEGFIMMQESIYSKLVLNGTAAGLMQEKVRKQGPARGLVQMLVVTEKQFNSIEYVVGGGSHEVIHSTNRLIIL